MHLQDVCGSGLVGTGKWNGSDVEKVRENSALPAVRPSHRHWESKSEPLDAYHHTGKWFPVNRPDGDRPAFFVRLSLMNCEALLRVSNITHTCLPRVELLRWESG